MPPRKVWVPMPQSDLYPRSITRDEIVSKFGETTVGKAEMAVVMNLLYLMGAIKPTEFVDLVVRQCQRIDEERRKVVGLEADRG